MNDINSVNTKCVHSGTIEDAKFGGLLSPIYPSTSYLYLEMDKRAYPRYFNTPNQEAVARKIAALEMGEAGLIFSSGMAAISTTLMSFLKSGDHAVFQKGLYGGTTKLIDTIFNDYKIKYSVTEGLTASDFEKCLRKETKLIYIETPSNPLLNIADIAAITELARSKNVLTVIDNTFASPINQNPIQSGIDIVIHSATKYLSGHSDICAGAVVSNRQNMDIILGRAKVFGGSLDTQTCYLLERSIKTMAIRVKQQNINALKIAKYLQQHVKIAHVYYPGLAIHPQHEIATKQMHGFGGMLSFELRESIDTVQFQKKLRLIRPSMSLGGVESIICSSALTSHAVLNPDQRREEGIKDSLLRLSVGIEDPQELIADIDQALFDF